MATQHEAGVEFSLFPEENHQHFRLLELPSELFEIISNGDASLLELKSQEQPPGSTSAPNVVLCTQNKTYNVRQVSTSNSLFVVKPAAVADDSLHDPALEAIAQCTSTLELQLDKTGSALQHIKTGTALYTQISTPNSSSRSSKSQLFANIPLSQRECDQAWRELCCFEIDDGAFMPNSTVLVEAWKAMLEAANAAAIDLTQPIDKQKLLLIVDNGDKWPKELNEAILRKSAASNDLDNVLQLDAERLTRTVGLALLKQLSKEGKVPVAVEAFESAWADLLPEKWREKAQREIINGSYKQDGAGLVSIGTVADGSAASAGNSASEAKSTLGAKRKWHEKFRAQKKAV